MKRLILEMGAGNDLYGMDYTKAAIRALDNALHHSSLMLFRALDIPHGDMPVKVTIGVQEPDQVDIEKLAAHIPRGQPDITVTFGGQNIKDPETDSCAVVASCAVEAFVPINARDWLVKP
ncbi:MAG: Lin0512 family protein [Paracoccaceae bacterium]